MTPAQPVVAAPVNRVPAISAAIAGIIIPINVGVWFMSFTAPHSKADPWFGLFSLLALGQLVAGIVAVVAGIRGKRVAPIIIGTLCSLGALGGWVLGLFGLALGSMGGAWGRPLRVRGRQLHPELKEGADWTCGEQPDASRLDAATRRALEALWLHDAQKEHASVPAFSRVSWMLAAVGAPAELLTWSHRAALEEIEHTQLCFALAAGYAGRSYTVEPMPDLLLGGLDVQGRPLEVLARESLGDGCLLEDFNADVAAECARVCREPVTKRVLEQIAREERSHAEFSWAVLRWLVDTHGVQPDVSGLDAYPRPTAVSWDKAALVAAADAEALRAHGRLPDERWGELWTARLEATKRRAAERVPRQAA
jgi:hypothetical protein